MALNADIEQLILSGQFFNGGSRSSSPARSESTASDTDEATLLDLGEGVRGDHNDIDYRNSPHNIQTAGGDSIPDTTSGANVGVGVPGRTGVKGVIRDRNEALQLDREKRIRDIEDLNARLEKSHLGGKTYLEEEREKALRGGEKVDPLVLDEMERVASRARDMASGTRGRFGHLREVGMKAFVSAVENEARGVWVIVHLYDPSLDRCYMLDQTLSQLARQFPNTKFIRSRASALGFASASSSSSRRLRTSNNTSPSATRTISRPALFPGSYNGHDSDDEDYSSHIDEKVDEDDEEDLEDDNDEVEVDTDMLPTMLVYRDGELVFNWVRVDWEAGNSGIAELLMQNHVLPRTTFTSSDADLLGEDDLDDAGEVDLRWSDENW